MEELWLKFIEHQKVIDDRELLYSTTFTAVAPTMVRLKPATLIQYVQSQRNLLKLWQDYRSQFCGSVLTRMNIDYFELQDTQSNRLVCLYRRPLLEAVLKEREVYCFLKNHGISGSTIEDYFLIFKRRMEVEFPHEIGVLLGYPVKDVSGFIENSGKNFLLNGYWKVYHQPKQAARIFKFFDGVKRIVLDYYLKRWKKGLGEDYE